MYALVTAAKNEEELIEKTIQSVIEQSILPLKWIIISDGSTDETDNIILKYEKDYEFIQYFRTESSAGRNFGSKAKAIESANHLLKKLKIKYLGFLDADVTFDNNYFEQVILHAEKNHRLGITGGSIYELINGIYIKQNNHIGSVAGAVQFFNFSCYNEIGGYRDLRYGGIDSVAEVMARMYGWEVHSIKELHVQHHRQVGASGGRILKSKFRYGQREYFRGTMFIFWILKCIRRVTDYPYIISSFYMIGGYIYSCVFQRELITLSQDFLKYTKQEQKKRLIDYLKFSL